MAVGGREHRRNREQNGKSGERRDYVIERRKQHLVSRFFFFSSRRRHTRYRYVTGVQTCALPICGLQPRCRVTDKPEWGADAIFTLSGSTMDFKSYYKLPVPQTSNENCVAHNGTLIPVPGRDIMAQGWYQGGISVFDWTDPSHPMEIAFFDRGPMDSTKLVGAGSWSAYWYNGYIISSEIARGLDILELKPSTLLTQNEIDAAKLIHFDYLNAQDQQKLVWPASFVVARAYVDQLERSHGLPTARIKATRARLQRAEKASGLSRRRALSTLATQLGTDARGSSDQAKV